uniref:Tetratricopeptide repeat protein 5 OB fold domain-containing protein n=1 Tax=Ciona savignyi TaxID=51511 RepID=H2YMA6_CIOSA
MATELQASQLVDKLYDFRDNFITNHGFDRVHDKPTMVQCEVTKTIKELQTLEPKCQKTAYMLQYARALNVVPDYSRECEDYLSKVVKRDPSIVQGWNLLGETFWKKGDIPASKDCFEGALKRSKDKVSLRSLSMVLRQMKAEKMGDEERNVIASVEMAKEAVGIDGEDGMSWYVLGNAYLALFFVTQQNPKVLGQALHAYAEAEKVEQRSTHNPDLHFNRSMVYRYDESYKLALEGLKMADKLDPSWGSPQIKINELINYLDKVNELVDKRGKLKTKRLQSLIKSIKENDLGELYISMHTRATQCDTMDCRNPGFNLTLHKPNLCVLAPCSVPHYLLNQSGVHILVGIHVLQGKGVIIGDTVAIPEPFMTHHKFEWDDSAKQWDFRNIRVDNPIVLVVNGKKLTKDHCGYTIGTMIPSGE